MSTDNHKVPMDHLEDQLAVLDKVQDGLQRHKSLMQQRLRELNELYACTNSLQRAKLETFQDTGSEAWLQEMDEAFLSFRKKVNVHRNFFVRQRSLLIELFHADDLLKKEKRRDALTELHKEDATAIYRLSREISEHTQEFERITSLSVSVLDNDRVRLEHSLRTRKT